MRYALTFILLFLFPLNVAVSSSPNETLPSWHWAYEYLDRLQLRGLIAELYLLNKPYTRGDVARVLISLNEKIEQEKTNPSGNDMAVMKRLQFEFRQEIEEIREAKRGINEIRMGGRMEGGIDNSDESNVKYAGRYRSMVSGSLSPHVTMYNGMVVDDHLANDTTYVGKRWGDIVAYTEQAYVSVGLGRFRFKLGRDFLRWGAGRNGTLLISGVTRPLDQFTGSARIGPFQYTYMASALDDLALGRELADSLGGSLAKRYISAHRLDVRLFGGRLQCAVTEAVVYGGIHRQPEWAYLNPFVVFHAAQLNDEDYNQANTIGTLDLLFYPIRNWELYCSLLIDDIQVEKNQPSDLAPNRIGWLAGSRWADPVGLAGLVLSGEYVRITNRTYVTNSPWETYIHRNVPLGHPLGNDFDHWQIHLQKWIRGIIRLGVGYSYTQQGEGNLFTPWEEPWLEYSVEQGYSEPFPTGVVEKSGQWSFSAKYFPSIHWGVEAEFFAREIHNADNMDGVRRSKTSWRIGLWWDGEIAVGF
jgi:hypothetical protein